MSRYSLGIAGAIILLVAGVIISELYRDENGLRSLGAAITAVGALWGMYVRKNRKHLI